MQLTYHQDPGHGWVEVPLSLLERLNLLGKISAFSYVDADKRLAYLEEDADLSLFMHVAKDHDITPRLCELHCNSYHWIRELPRFENNHHLNWS